MLRTVSPTSLKVTLRALLLGANMSFGECLQMEYRLGAHFCEGSDFHEGKPLITLQATNAIFKNHHEFDLFSQVFERC